jgi:hypothetical protein
MRSHALVALAVSVVLSGCVVREHNNVPPPGPVPQPGNVDMVWSFADGQTCSSLGPFADHIRINIPGETLANGGRFPCQTGGTQGVQLQDFAPASYTYTITAEDSNNYPLYQATGAFVVNGNIQVVVSFTRLQANPQSGAVAVYWTFPNGQTCQSAGIDHMVINIPGEVLANGGVFPCQTSAGPGQPPVPGIQLNDFAPKSYTISIDGVEASGSSRFHGEGGFTINGNTTVSVALQPTAGSLATLQLRWSFGQNGGGPLTCAPAGVDHVVVGIGNAQPQSVACSVNGVDGADFTNVTAGQYGLQLQGTRNGQVVYSYSQNVVVSSPATLINVVLAPLFGSWDLFYNFSNASSCAVAGVSFVTLSVKDASGTEISGTNGQHIACGDAATSSNGIHYTEFPAGNVTIQMYGYSAGGAPVRGASRATTLNVGAANQTTVTLDTCGTAGAGC